MPGCATSAIQPSPAACSARPPARKGRSPKRSTSAPATGATKNSVAVHERAVLILRDVLGWTGTEAAELLDTTVTAVNSALQRARGTIEAEAPARVVAPGRRTQRELLRRYVDAWERADMPALLELLVEDAVMTMPPQPAAFGREAIIAIFQHRCVAQLHLSATAAWVNGTPAVELRDPAGELHRLLVLDVVGDRITHVGAYRVPKEGQSPLADL
jgi:RNA polymerase sigma-70 factor (ECF subfamily)